jgi:hypothetical protein
MSVNSPGSNVFILSAFDQNRWCPVLQARFSTNDLDGLRSILGDQASQDPDLRHQYVLDDDRLGVVVEQFAVAFDPTGLQCQARAIFLHRKQRLSDAPYLIHTGYELPLLLSGRKKLARMSHEYPPATFEGEDRFDHWVSRGTLHKLEVVEPFDKPIKDWLGHRTVYYTPIGEKWRVPAMQMLFKASGRSGGWNEHFERLEGMLLGYSDLENDWWINIGLQGGGFGGVALCCAVDAAGLAWIEAAGFRALPPSSKPTLRVMPYQGDAVGSLQSILFDPDSTAIVRFNVLGRHAMGIIDLREAGPWDIPAHQIPDLNRHLRGSVALVALHHPPIEPAHGA